VLLPDTHVLMSKYRNFLSVLLDALPALEFLARTLWEHNN
jgi:hypothetical protein